MADPKATVQVTLVITETAGMDIDVGFSAKDVDSGEKIQMRPSHLIGLLESAKLFVMAENYDNLKVAISPIGKKK